MLSCPKCKVTVAGNKERCPLCQGEFAGEPSRDAYPRLQQNKFTKHFLLRIISFCAISLIILSLALNLTIRPDIPWCLFAIGALLCLWGTSSVGITFRKRLYKNLTIQLFLITAASVLWDVSIGWNGWSIDYVLPCICIAYMISIIILSRIIKGPKNAYIIYLFIDCVLGLVPVIFIFTGVLRLPILSVLCVALSLITLFGLLFFDGHAFKEEITKKLHV